MNVSKEDENFFKIAKIILDIIPKHMRALFITKWDANNQNVPWANDATSGQLLYNAIPQSVKRNKGRFHDTLEQMILGGDITLWDPTALFFAFLYSGLTLIDPCRKDKGQWLPPLRTSENIDRLRVIRNSCFAHPPSISVPAADFVKISTEIKDIAREVFDTTVENEIDLIINSPVTTELSKQLQSQLNLEKQINDDFVVWQKGIEECLEEVKGGLKDLAEDVNGMKGGLHGIAEDVKEVKGGLQDLAKEIDVLHKQIAEKQEKKQLKPCKEEDIRQINEAMMYLEIISKKLNNIHNILRIFSLRAPFLIDSAFLEMQDSIKHVIERFKVLLPVVKQCFLSIKCYSVWLQELTIDEWWDNIDDVIEDAQAHGKACVAHIGICEQILYMIAKNNNSILDLLSMLEAVSDEHKIPTAPAGVMRNTLIPALSLFRDTIHEIGGLFAIIEDTMDSISHREQKARDAQIPKCMHYKVMKAKASNVIDFTGFLAKLRSIWIDLQAIFEKKY